jgi:hypothetical protein
MQPTSPGGRNETSTDDAFNVFCAHGPGSGSRRASQRASAGTKPGAFARTKPVLNRTKPGRFRSNQPGRSRSSQPGRGPEFRVAAAAPADRPGPYGSRSRTSKRAPLPRGWDRAPRRRSPRPRRTQHPSQRPCTSSGPRIRTTTSTDHQRGPGVLLAGDGGGEPVGQQDRVDPGVGVGLGGVEVVQVDEDLLGGGGEVAAGARSGSVLPPGLLNSASNATQR